MGSPVDLTLGCSTTPSSTNGCHTTDILRTSSSFHPGEYLESLRKAEEYLQSLEDERRKVEGFKRELPLCIQLLEDAIETSKEKVASGKKELQVRRSSMDCEKEYRRPRLEEFMPLNMNCMPLKRRWGTAAEEQSEGPGSDGETEGTSQDTSDQQQQRGPERGSKRPAWMVEAQLWTQHSVSSDQTCHEKEKEMEQFEQEQSSVTSSQQQQILPTLKERPAGAFLPFLREHPATAAATPMTVSRPIPRTGSGAGLSLSFGEPQLAACSPPGSTTAILKTTADHNSEVGSIDANNQMLLSKETTTAMATATCNGVNSGAGSSSGGQSQSQRKARRCWSPELHRRFVSALHQLGGCQIATPKQIRELMKVDGLTNDEVKSHLQKFRLHTRRPSPSQQSAPGSQQPPQLVVLGGIWVPPKYTASGSQPGYDPQHQPQFCHSGLPQDGSYFACISNGAAGAPVQMSMHRQPIFEPQQAASQSQCSPQGPLQVTSQLSGATQGLSSSEVYHDESGEEEEEAKSDSTSWKTRRSAERDNDNILSSKNTGNQKEDKSNLNLEVACSVQSDVNTASEVNEQAQ